MILPIFILFIQVGRLKEVSQYRTPTMVQKPKMTYPQYKYKNFSSWYYKSISYANKISGSNDSGWFLGSKPY